MKKILIIDDEFIFRQGLRYMMDWESCGYTIAGEASNGQEGLEAVRQLSPDLILCDIVMPIMDGVEFVRQIHGLEGPPVVMLSNYDEFDKVRKAFQYGAADYLLKSRVTREDILKCLDRFSSPKSQTGTVKPAKSFQNLARQVLDGYAKEPYKELSAYIKSRIPAPLYSLLYIDAPSKDYPDERLFQEALEIALPGRSLLTAITSQSHGIAIIGVDQEEDISWCPSFLGYLSSHVVHSSCVLGLPFSNLALFREKLEALYELSRYSILFEDKLAFFETDLTKTTEEAPPFPTELYGRCTGQGKWAEAFLILSEYLETFKNQAAINPYKFKSLIEHTMYNTLNDARKFTKNQTEINRIELKLFKQTDYAVRYSEVIEALAAAFCSLSTVCPTQKNMADPIIDSLLLFLGKNYFRQITLYDAAEYLHMNYSYLSAYISQNTDKHFSEHLNETRVAHAKELLEATSLSISDISSAIGYADQSYFGKVFKKLSGLTPLQYRNARTGKRDLDE